MITNVSIVSKRRLENGAQDIRVSFTGDDNVPAGGTLAFTDTIKAAIKAAAVAADDANVQGGQPGLEIVDVISGDCGTYVAQYLKATDALKVRDGEDFAEVTGDTSSTTFNVTCICK